jgi:hypothetical protein
MENGIRLIKRMIALSLVLLLSIESFGAIVSDNDGSAFITKAEFDSLKNSFQSQIDQYNTSIDSKIDGAIASYLAGIKVSTSEKLNLDSKTEYRFPLIMFYNDNSWNNVTSDYYTLSRPRLRVPKYSLWAMPENGRETANMTIIDDDSFKEESYTVAPSNANARMIVASLLEEVWDLKSVYGEVTNVKDTGEQRSLGGVNYNIFNLVNEGEGYQYIDYKVSTELSLMRNGGNYNIHGASGTWKDKGFIYGSCLGLDSSKSPGTSQLRTNPQNYKINWTSDNPWGTLGCSVDTERSWPLAKTVYDYYVSANINQKRRWNTLAGEWDGTVTWLTSTSITPGDVDSSNFFWQEEGRKYLFAGNSYLPAQEINRFGFEPDWSNGQNTEVTYLAYTQPDFHRAVYINRTEGDLWVDRWSVKRPLWCPPLMAAYYSGIASENINAFSGLPAACVRWYDEEGIEHYLDEGMFLKTFANLSGEAEVSFEVTFGTKSSATENVNFYVSKKPFNRVNAKSQLYPFKVDREASEVTSKTLETGKKYKITVDDIKKNDQLYILWEPTDGYNKMVQLDSFENFTLTKK